MVTKVVPGQQVVNVPTGTSSPEASLIWTDPVTGRRGYLVIDRLIRGVCSGGLRMREGCTFEEVHELAAAMSVKEVLHYDPTGRYIPMGGAKGGIDFNPLSSAARGVLSRFLEFIRPHLETHWATGDDLGTSAELIEGILDELGVDGCTMPVLRLSNDPVAARKRFDEAFSIEVDGIGLGELVGGCGVAESVLAMLDQDGISPSSATAVIQGFGSMGGATARFLYGSGVRVTAIADVYGTVANPNGLAIEEILANRLPYGVIDRTKLRRHDVQLPSDSWLDIETDVMVPAANSYCIDMGNQQRIRSRYVVEAANLPVSSPAEAALASRGIVTLPDVVVNSGTNAWWWWVLFGDIESNAAESFAKVRTSLRSLVEEMLDIARGLDISPRHSARTIADTRFHRLMARLSDGQSPKMPAQRGRH